MQRRSINKNMICTAQRLGITTMIAILGCSGQKPIGPDSKPVVVVEKPADINPPLTRVDATQILAGEMLSVSCLNNASLAPIKAIVVVTPDPGPITQTKFGATLAPTIAATYHIVCQASETSVEDPKGVDVTVRAGLAYAWNVSVPTFDCLGVNDVFTIDHEVTDRFGNVVTLAVVDAAVSPAAGSVGSITGGFRFTEDGHYTVTVQVNSETAADSTIAPRVFELDADTSPPIFEITSPYRNTMLTQGPEWDTQVKVTGRVYDTLSPITKAEVAGYTLPTTGGDLSVAFNINHTSRWGLSIIVGSAEDACGNIARLVHPYLRSGHYYDQAMTPYSGAKIDTAMVAQLNQDFVDDGNRRDLNDLASLVQSALRITDFNTMAAPGEFLSTVAPSDRCNGFPGPTFVSTGFTAWRDSQASNKVVLEEPTIGELFFVQDGVKFDASFTNFSFPFRLRVDILTCNLGVTDSTSITVHGVVGLDAFRATGTIGAALASGNAQAAIKNIAFALYGPKVQLDCGMMNWACDPFVDAIVQSTVAKLQARVEKAIAQEIPPLLVEALPKAGTDVAINLTQSMGMTLNSAVNLSSLGLCGLPTGLPMSSLCHGGNGSPGSVSFGVDAQFFPSSRGANLGLLTPGPISMGGYVPQFSSKDTSFGIGVRLDLINQLAWALWYGGGFDKADWSLNNGNVSVSMVMGLPPVVMPGRGSNLFDLGLGDLRMKGTVDVGKIGNGPDAPSELIDIDMSLSTVLAMGIVFDETTGMLHMQTDPTAQMEFEIHAINKARFGDLVAQVLSQTLTDELPTKLNEGLRAIQLPKIDLSAFINQNVSWSIQNPSLQYVDGFLTLSGVIGS